MEIEEVSAISNAGLQNDASDLNAGLTILILPIDGQLPRYTKLFSDPFAGAEQGDSSSLDELAAVVVAHSGAHGDFDEEYLDTYPFLPYRLCESTESIFGDELRLVATAEHVIEREADKILHFGRSRGTLNESPNAFVWQGHPSVCISLWSTTSGLALTIERMHHLSEEQSGDERVKEPFLGKAGVESALSSLLSGTGLTADSDLASLLRSKLPVEVLAEYVLLRNADALSTVGERSALDLFVEGPGTARGQRFAEGLMVHIEPEASGKVSRLVVGGDDFEELARMQSETFPWQWTSIPLVTQPVEAGAEIAIREDGRSVFLNLEAMSFNHDYAGHGGMYLVISCIPYVISQARSAADCRDIAEMIDDLSSDGDDPVEDRLEKLITARDKVEEAQKRQALWAYRQRFNHKEKFSIWTHGGQLAAILSQRNTTRAEDIAHEVQKMSDVLGRSIELEIQRSTIQIQEAEKERQRSEEARESRRPLRIIIESVAVGAAALSLFVGLIMTTAAAPALEGAGTVGIWPAVLIASVTVLAGTLLGRFLRRFR